MSHYKKKWIRIIKDYIIRVKISVYCSSNLVLWSINLKNISKPSEDERNNINCKLIKNEDLIVIKSDLGADLSEKFSEWLKSSYGFIITYKDRVIGYSWSTKNAVKKQGSPPFLFNIQPNKGYSYGFGDYIIPEMRGKGMGSILMGYRYYILKKNNITQEFGFVDIKNTPQNKIMEKYGFNKRGNLHFKKILWKTTTKLSGIEEFCKISLL